MPSEKEAGENEREDAVERAIRHYPEPLVDARELTDAVLEETDAFDDLADPRREVLDCLKVLRRTGEVVSHSPGSNAITWAHRDRVIMDPPPRDPSEHPDQAALEEAADVVPGVERDEIAEDPYPEPLDGVDVPAGVDRAGAAAAVVAVVQLLEVEGSATKAEIVREVMPHHSLKYDADDAIGKLDAGERYRGAWWRKVVKPGLKASDDVDAPPRGGSEWTYSSSTSS